MRVGDSDIPVSENQAANAYSPPIENQNESALNAEKRPINSPESAPGAAAGVSAAESAGAAPKRMRTRQSPAAVPKPDDVPEQLWRDWLAVRKAKRAPLTATALAGVRREAKKAGLSLEQAIQICVEWGWQGFRAEWMENRSQRASGRAGPSRAGTHAGLGEIDYTKGVNADGTFA